MIIHNIPYVHIDGEEICTTTACLTMTLGYLGENISPTQMGELFVRTLMSREFNDWYLHSIDTSKFEDNPMLSCAYYTVFHYFPWISAQISKTTFERVRTSHLKRNIPVIMTGAFPMLSGKVATSVVLKGYLDDYFVVNDPRGNANSGYRDSLGENVMYSHESMVRWVAPCGEPDMLRLLSRRIPTEPPE